MSRPDDRTRLLAGDAAVERLSAARVLVAGAGGVGGYAAEMLVRSGIGRLTLIDADSVDITNLNRQIIATRSSVGKPKTTLFGERFRDINPQIHYDGREIFLTPENIPAILDEGFDFVVDAIDTVAPKCALIAQSVTRNIPVISSMGAGGRLDPTKVRVVKLSQTNNDGLARAVRTRLRREGIRLDIPAVWSEEIPRRRVVILNDANKISSPGSMAPVPSTFGIFMAAYVINKLISE